MDIYRSAVGMNIPVREDFFKKVKNGCDILMGKKWYTAVENKKFLKKVENGRDKTKG